MTACVYSILNVVNGNRYIGGTIDFTKRQRTHIRLLNKNQHPNVRLQRAWFKYGSGAFRFIIVGLINRLDDVLTAEQAWIDGYQPEYNIAKSASAPMLGRPLTNEHRLKLSKALKGRIMSDETRRKMSEANLGKKFSAETLMRMSAAQKGKKQSPEFAEKRRQGALRHWKTHKHPRLTLTCRNPKCGREFKRLPCQLPHPNSGSFCSVSCRGQVIGCQPRKKKETKP